MSGTFFVQYLFNEKVRVKGQRSHESFENYVLACISVVSGTVGMNVGIVVYNHKWVVKRSGSEVKGRMRGLKTMF